MLTFHATSQDLRAALPHICESPRWNGVVRLIVSRPDIDVRQVVAEGTLSVNEGLVGDSWSRRHNPRTADGTPNPATQLNIMNARVAACVAGDLSRWPLAGDQLFVDLDLSVDNLPPFSRLRVGTAVVEVSTEPHTGCGKFVDRFGLDAMKFVNSPQGRQLNLRGINGRVIVGGVVRPGDAITKMT